MKNTSDRSIDVQTLPMIQYELSAEDVYEKKRVMEVSVSFYDGWNGGLKGYFLHFTPVTIEKRPTCTARCLGLYGYGGGGKVRIENAERFNAKRLAFLAAEVTNTPLYRDTLLAVLGDQENDTEIAPEAISLLPETMRESAESVMAALRPARIEAREAKMRQNSDRVGMVAA